MGSTASSEASGFDATALTVHGAPAPTTYGSASRYYSPPVGLERALGLARQGKWSLVQAAMGGGPVNEKVWIFRVVGVGRCEWGLPNPSQCSLV